MKNLAAFLFALMTCATTPSFAQSTLPGPEVSPIEGGALIMPPESEIGRPESASETKQPSRQNGATGGSEPSNSVTGDASQRPSSGNSADDRGASGQSHDSDAAKEAACKNSVESCARSLNE